MIVNPLEYIFNSISTKYNFVLAIVVTSMSIKFTVIPIYVIRFRNEKLNKFFKDHIDKLELTTEQKSIIKKNKKYIRDVLGLKSKKVMVSLFFLELIILVILINTIKRVDDSHINLGHFYLVFIYIITLVINELLYIHKAEKKYKKIQCIFSSIVVIILYHIVKKLQISIIIFWIISSIFGIVLNLILSAMQNKLIDNISAKTFNNILINIINDKR